MISKLDEQLAIDVSLNATQTSTSGVQQKRSFGQFMHKYFLEGQKLHHEDKQPDSQIAPKSDLGWTNKYRNQLAFLIPFGFFQLCWWSLAIRYNLFARYAYRYQMPLTMILGAFISGATSEGGGAVAFPVMTLLLKLDPTVARDFSLMIQSCGMAASGFSVLLMRIKIERHSIFLCSIGAFFSVIFGVQFCDELFTSQVKKMMFVSIWFSFAISLFILNTQHKRLTYDQIPNFNYWKGCVLFLTGFIGGFLTALTGSGVDICSFCVLTLLFRVSEKVATPTSVVLMWINTWVGFYWRHLIMNGISSLAWEYFSVSVPIVVTMSPLGALVASILHRQVLAVLIYVLETFSVIGFLLTKPEPALILIGFIIVVIGSLFFLLLSHAGRRLSDHVQTDRKPLCGLSMATTTANSYSLPSSSASSSPNNSSSSEDMPQEPSFVDYDCVES